MSTRVQSPMKRTAAPARSLTPVPFGILQRKCACGGSGGSEGECEECKKKQMTLQRFSTGRAAPASVPPIVHDVLRSPGQPLDPGTRAFLEPRFGHDFGKIRIHTDEKAEQSAKAVNAAAYAVGRHVAFASGQYKPGTKAGQWLIAHELSHVVQQGGAGSGWVDSDANFRLELGHSANRAEQEASRTADTVTDPRGGYAPSTILHAAEPAVQRHPDDEWDKPYVSYATINATQPPKPGVYSYLQKPYEEFKSGLGEIRPSTEGGLAQNVGRWGKTEPRKGAGIPAGPEITMPMLKEIYPGLAKDVAADKGKEEQAKKYLDSLNQAFKIMKIDTVEAQSNYLAHAFIESDQFRQFTETQGSLDASGKPVQIRDEAHPGKFKPNPEAGPPQKWVDKPQDVKLNRSELKKYSETGDVNPQGTAAFIGRGPVQVTHRAEYVEVVATLEKAAEQYYANGLREMREAEAQYESDNDLSTYGKKTDRWIKLLKNGKLCREAAQAVKAHPEEAANPKYTFLVSAAFMKNKGADVKVARALQPNLSIETSPDLAKTWTGEDPASGWVAGVKQTQKPQVEALKRKGEAYDHIYRVLCRESPACSKAAPQAFQE